MYITVESEAFSAYKHTGDTLTIQFKNGAEYQYYGVTEADLDAMLESTSVGAYFNLVIKKCFTCKKVSQ